MSERKVGDKAAFPGFHFLSCPESVKKNRKIDQIAITLSNLGIHSIFSLFTRISGIRRNTVYGSWGIVIRPDIR